jgi:hypothetical protein
MSRSRIGLPFTVSGKYEVAVLIDTAGTIRNDRSPRHRMLGREHFLVVALPFEFRSNLSTTTEPEKPSRKPDEAPAVQNDRPAIGQLTATILARPLFSPTRRPPETDAADNSATSLSDMRLTGILITPDQRLAIFAPAGAKPLVRSEGEMLGDWRIESIADQSVSLTGPTGATSLEPKADPNLVRVAAAQQPAAKQSAAQQAMAPPPQPAAPAANTAAPLTNPRMLPAGNAPVPQRSANPPASQTAAGPVPGTARPRR